jgi:hypothetical protein
MMADPRQCCDSIVTKESLKVLRELRSAQASAMKGGRLLEKEFEITCLFRFLMHLEGPDSLLIDRAAAKEFLVVEINEGGNSVEQ